MKIVFSPLIAGMSGRAADAVAASWKGRNYIRKFVVPHNPQTDAQTAVRESLARCVTLWRSLTVPVKAWLDKYATAYRMSGYNTFISKNRALEDADSLLKPVPDNPHVDPMPGFTYSSEPSADVIRVTWTASGLPGFTHVFLASRDILSNAFLHVTLSGLDATEYGNYVDIITGHTYQLYAALYNPTTGAFGTIASDVHTQT